MSGGRISVEWKGYETHVRPDGVHESQRIGTRRAFYGGALAMFGIFFDLGKLEEEESNKILDDLHNELIAFKARVDAGEA